MDGDHDVSITIDDSRHGSESMSGVVVWEELSPGLLVLDPTDGIAWEDETTGEEKVLPDVVVNAARTLVVFDFDCTLTSNHLFHALHGGDGDASRARLAEDPDSFYLEIFGGAERVEMLRAFLRDMKEAGATLRILSFGREAEIEAALEWMDVRVLFDEVHGSASYTKRGIHGARHSKQRMIATYLLQENAATKTDEEEVVVDDDGALRPATSSAQQQYLYDHLIFADDDRGNFPGTQLRTRRQVPQLFDAWKIARDTVTVADTDAAEALPSSTSSSSTASSSVPGTVVVAWPAGDRKNGSGLTKRDCERLLQFTIHGGGV